MEETMKIRRLLIAKYASGLLFGLAVIAGGSAAAAETIRFAFDWFPTSGDTPVLAAQKFGWFAEEGIELKITPGGEFNQVLSVGIGEHDITVGPGPSVLFGHQEELPVIAVGVTQPFSPVGLICRPDRGLNPDDPTSLKGVKVGIQPGEAYNTVWESYRDYYGLKGQVEEIPVGWDPIVMFTGQVDCFPDFLSLVPALAAEEFGEPAVTYWTSAAVETIGQTIVTNDTFAAEHPDLVRGFVRAYARGMQWALRNTAEAIDLFLEFHPDFERSVMEVEAPALQSFWVSSAQEAEGLLFQNDQTWQPTHDTLSTYGFIKKPFDVSLVYTTEFLPDPPIMP
jgi:NitT/TauT family transport system substrate-binding protein